MHDDQPHGASAPCSISITDVNAELGGKPELVNSDPFGEGWLMKVTLSDSSELDALMDAGAYADETA